MLLLSVLTSSASAASVLPADPSPKAVVAYATQYEVSPEEARRRLSLQGKLWDIAEEARVHLGDAYGGLYFDNQKGGFRVFATDPASRGVDGLQAYLRARAAVAEVEIQATDFSLSALRAARDGVTQRLIDAGLGDYAIVGIDLDGSAVRVEVASPKVTDVASMNLAVPVALDGHAEEIPVRVVDSGRETVKPTEMWCAFPDCTTPLHAAARITNESPSPPSNCSIAGHAQSSAGRKFVITAAHCAFLNAKWQARHPSSGWSSVGTVTLRGTGANGDIELVEIPSVSFWSPGVGWSNPLLAAWSEGLHDYTIDNAVSPAPGLFVGWGGQTSYGFGTTSMNNVDITFNGYGHQTQVIMNQGCVATATSGGAVWNTHVIYGVINSAAGCYDMWMTDIKRVYYNWGVYIAT